MDAKRKKMIAKIKIAQQQLDLDDGTYRNLLQNTVGKRSAALMDEHELQMVLEVMKVHGFQDQNHRENKPSVSISKKPLLSKIEALLAESGKPWRYAEAMAERMFHKQKLQWLNHDQLHRLVAALQIQANRTKNKEVSS